MSGHSKWAQIKRQKGAADVKRGAAFTKLGNAITIAVRDGGGIGDPESNFKLRLAVEKARAANMPKDNIERAIDKGLGKSGSGEVLENVTYEGFGSGGTAILIEVITDNKQRTIAVLKGILDRAGGRLGGSGAVSYMFDSMGLITIFKDGKDMDEVMMAAADAGAEEVEDGGDVYEIYTKPEDLNSVKMKLNEMGFKVIEADLFRKANTVVKIADKDVQQKIFNLMGALEEADDVHKVYSNFDV